MRPRLASPAGKVSAADELLDPMLGALELDAGLELCVAALELAVGSELAAVDELELSSLGVATQALSIVALNARKSERRIRDPQKMNVIVIIGDFKPKLMHFWLFGSRIDTYVRFLVRIAKHFTC